MTVNAVCKCNQEEAATADSVSLGLSPCLPISPLPLYITPPPFHFSLLVGVAATGPGLIEDVVNPGERNGRDGVEPKAADARHVDPADGAERVAVAAVDGDADKEADDHLQLPWHHGSAGTNLIGIVASSASASQRQRRWTI